MDVQFNKWYVWKDKIPGANVKRVMPRSLRGDTLEVDYERLDGRVGDACMEFNELKNKMRLERKLYMENK